MDELNKLIESIPLELRDCFYIKINYNLAKKIIDQFAIYNRECLTFPCTYKGIQVVLNKMANNELEVIPNEESYLKVSSYEINKAEKFLNEYEELCRKHNLSIGGCGCCDSPYLDDEFHTISIGNILYNEGKLKYEISYTYKAREYLQVGKGE